VHYTQAQAQAHAHGMPGGSVAHSGLPGKVSWQPVRCDGIFKEGTHTHKHTCVCSSSRSRSCHRGTPPPTRAPPSPDSTRCCCCTDGLAGLLLAAATAVAPSLVLRAAASADGVSSAEVRAGVGGRMAGFAEASATSSGGGIAGWAGRAASPIMPSKSWKYSGAMGCGSVAATRMHASDERDRCEPQGQMPTARLHAGSLPQAQCAAASVHRCFSCRPTRWSSLTECPLNARLEMGVGLSFFLSSPAGLPGPALPAAAEAATLRPAGCIPPAGAR
jgi:hypothetical protein